MLGWDAPKELGLLRQLLGELLNVLAGIAAGDLDQRILVRAARTRASGSAVARVAELSRMKAASRYEVQMQLKQHGPVCRSSLSMVPGRRKRTLGGYHRRLSWLLRLINRWSTGQSMG